MPAAIKLAQLPAEQQDQLRRERREASRAAAHFAAICAGGDADLLYDAALWLDQSYGDSWRLAMVKIAELPAVSHDIQKAFLPIWIEHKMLPLRVGDRPVLAKALRVLMPCDYGGPPLTLYRGTGGNERRRHLYGFSWTMDQTIARGFAERWAQPDLQIEGVVLRAVVLAKAILLIREPEDYYDEGEVVVDPYRIDEVDIVERLS
jgi:hypothetical protein